MVKMKAGEGGEYPDIIPENELVNVRLAGVAEDSYEWQGETVHKLKWDFTVTDSGPWQGKSVRGSTSTTFTAHPNCKAYNWAAALMNREIAAGEVVDTDDLIGLAGRIIISHRTDRQGRTWMNVKEVLSTRPMPAVTDPPF